MTKQDTLSRIFLSVYVILLFFKNVRTYPHVEFDKLAQNGNQTISTLDRENQSSISETNRTYVRDANTRGRLFQYDNPKLLDQANEHEHIDSKFVFPTENIPYTDSLSPILPRILAPICQGSTFCEGRILDYPEEIINNAIQQNSSIKFFATIDVIPDVVKRIGVDDTPLCVSTEQVIYPRSAESKSKEWFLIVNQDNFKQGVRIETCGSNENSKCNIIDSLGEGYKTTCKQKYIYRQLAAVSENGKVNPDMFRFPSSCCCHIKFTGDPATRLGIFGDQRNKQKTNINNRRK